MSVWFALFGYAMYKLLNALDFVELENYPKNLFRFKYFKPSKTKPKQQ